MFRWVKLKLKTELEANVKATDVYPLEIKLNSPGWGNCSDKVSVFACFAVIPKFRKTSHYLIVEVGER